MEDVSLHYKPESFKVPDGSTYLTIRAIVYDSWITWNDALPEEPEQRELLTEEIFGNIKELATRIHKVHQSLPNYKNTTEAPFNFVLWWDPTDPDKDWNLGKTCRFMIDDFSADDLLYYSSLKRGNRLLIKPLTKRLVEARAVPVPKKS